MDATSEGPAAEEARPPAGARLLILFAEEDRQLATTFEEHLALLRDEGLVSGWKEIEYRNDGQEPGGSWPGADVIVPLVSAPLLADERFGTTAWPRLLREGDSSVMVVPVVVRATRLGELERFLVLPRNGRAVREWTHPTDAWLDVMAGLRDRLTASTRASDRTDQSTGCVRRVVLQRFTVFEHAVLTASPGINVFIGLNGTGKSHALKVMYSLLRATRDGERALSLPRDQDTFIDKLTAVFKSGQLERRPRSKQAPRVSVECDRGAVSLDIARPGLGKGELSGARALFLPSREALSMYEGFASAYERRELSFDETYYDLCRELNALPLREKALGAFRDPLRTLEDAIGGTVAIAGTRFIVQSNIGDVEAHMVAEGMRKLASLAYLLRNGAVGEQTVLFWDEPEANLNPALVTVVAGVLRHLASLGVQIFIATHDYLLSRELSLAAEYGTTPQVDIRFHAFHRVGDEGAVEIESATTFAGLNHNPILDEFRAHHGREQALFYAPDGISKEVA